MREKRLEHIFRMKDLFVYVAAARKKGKAPTVEVVLERLTTCVCTANPPLQSWIMKIKENLAVLFSLHAAGFVLYAARIAKKNTTVLLFRQSFAPGAKWQRARQVKVALFLVKMKREGQGQDATSETLCSNVRKIKKGKKREKRLRGFL